MLAEALVERVLGEGAQVLDRFPGAALDGVRYEPPFPFLRGREYGRARATPCCSADFVTADDGTGLVHTAIAFGEDDFRLGERYGLNVVNPVLPDGTYDERIGQYAGRFVKDADADLIEDLERRGRLLRAEELRALLPALLALGTRSSTTPSRPGTSRPRRCATACWPPTRRSAGTRSTSSTGASATGWRATSTGRSRASATGARRCRSGADEDGNVTVHRLVRRARGALGRAGSTDPHRPYVDDVTFPCPQCSGKTARRVPEVIDVWFDSGAMPFAQWHAPFENEERFEEQFPADFICEAIDQTRGWFYSLLAISTLLFRPAAVRERRLPRPDPRRRGPEDVEVQGQHRRALGRHRPLRRRRVALVLLHLQAAVGRLPLLDGRRSARACACSCASSGTLRVLRPVRARRAGRGDRRRRRPSSTAGSARGSAATVEEVTERLDAYDATIAGRAIGELRRRPLQLVRAPLAAALLGGRRRARFATLREASLTVSQLLAPFTPFVADEIYENLDGSEPSRPPRATGPEPARATSSSSATWRRARDGARSACARAATAKVKLRQPLREAVVVAAGASATRSSASPTSCASELNVKALRFVGRRRRARRLELKPNYRALGPRFGKLDAAGRRGGRGARRLPRRRGAARGRPGRR